MRDLIILGTGIHALEMAEIAERVNQIRPTWRLLGYIAPDDRPCEATLNGVPVLGPRDKLGDYPTADLVPCNEGGWKTWPDLPRERLVSLIDPSCFVSRTARIGRGCAIYPHCYIGVNAVVGDLVFCLSGCVINHDDVIEDNVILASGVSLAGAVHVERNCYLGQSSSVRQHLRIGANSMLGMGAVVVKDVPPNSVMAGNPARLLRTK